MPFTASLLAAIIPMSLYLIIIWRMDKYEREPLSKVFKHFLWGAIGAIIFGLILSYFLAYASNLIFSSIAINSFIAAVLIAPFAEEIVKSLYLFNTYSNSYFDNLTDGLVYGGAIGLGFGMTENLLYFITYDESFSQWLTLVITRSVFSAVMHAIATATVGAFLAKAKFSNSPNKRFYPFIGLGLAMLFHASWNFSLSFEFTYFLGILFMFFLISSFFIIFYYSLNNEKKIILNELETEQIFQSLHPIKMNGKFSFNLLTKKYISFGDQKFFKGFVAKLAFRKLQVNNCTPKQKEQYLADIEYLKEQLILLINRNNKEKNFE